MKAQIMMKYLVTISILFVFDSIRGQEVLRIGEKIPNVWFNDLINYNGSFFKLSDLKGKLILFDFWSTSCGPCIEAMPKMDSLQKMYGDKISIFLVYPLEKITPEIKSSIQSFWESNQITKNVSLPTILDTTLRKLFGYRVAYQSWIDESNILRAKTTEEYVNKTEISRMLNGVYPDWEIATKEFYDFDIPLVQSFYKNNSDSQFNHLNGTYSLAMPYQSGIESGKSIKFDAVKNTTRFTCINTSLYNLYNEISYNINNSNNWGPNRIMLRNVDSVRFFKPRNEYLNEWLKKYSLSYELKIDGKPNRKDLYNKMRNELNKVLKLDARLEKVKVRCLIIKPKGEKITNIRLTKKEDSKVTNSYSIEDIVRNLNLVSGGQPVFCTTEVDKKINFPANLFQSGFSNIKLIRNLLNEAGLDVVESDEHIEMFVISAK